MTYERSVGRKKGRGCPKIRGYRRPINPAQTRTRDGRRVTTVVRHRLYNRFSRHRAWWWTN